MFIDHLLYFAVTLGIGIAVGWKLRGNFKQSTDPIDRKS